jgi:hypothetical protein
MEKFELYVTAVAIAAIAGMLYLMRGPNTALIKTRYRNRSKPKEETILIPILFALALGFVSITSTTTNFEFAYAQEQQPPQQSPPLNNTISPSTITENTNETTTSSVADNETGIGEPLPSPTQTNGTMLRGILGSIQAAHRGTFSWSTGGEWTMQLDGTLIGRPNPQIESFNATIQMVRLDGNILHEHEINDFNQTSVTQIGDDTTTFNGTMTVTLREGPIENVPGYIQLLGDSVSIWVDPRFVEEHFGATPIRGMVLPVEEV